MIRIEKIIYQSFYNIYILAWRKKLGLNIEFEMLQKIIYFVFMQNSSLAKIMLEQGGLVSDFTSNIPLRRAKLYGMVVVLSVVVSSGSDACGSSVSSIKEVIRFV